MGIENENDNFDMSGALDSISSDLGFSTDQPDDVLDGTGKLAGGGDGEPAPADTAASDPKPGEVQSPQGEQAATALTVPRTWRPEAAAEWANLSPTVQAEIAKREEDMFRGLEGYKADAAYGKNFQAIMRPYDNVLKQYNIDPGQQVAGLMQAHYTLALGTPEAKVALMRSLFSDYNIDPNAVFGQPDGQSPYMDPEVQRLRAELHELKSQTGALQSERQQQKAEAVEAEVAKFVADPANVYVKDLINDMVSILNSTNKSVKEAYEQAMWMNPAVRQREIDRQQAERAQKAAKEAEERVKAARKATAANVRSSAKSGGAAAPVGSMDDTLAETLAAINARA